MVMDEIAGNFENEITKALNIPDGTLAIDRMRQVAAVRQAGLRWLELPKRKLAELEQGQRDETSVQTRRPVGL